MVVRATCLVDRSFHFLVVLSRVPAVPGEKNSVWRVRCVCGCVFTALRTNLMNGNTRSCGCRREELWKASIGFGRFATRDRMQTTDQKVDAFRPKIDNPIESA